MYTRLLDLQALGNKSVLLLGPRGTGKTWWVKQSMPNALYLDLLDSKLYTDLLARPWHLANLIAPDFSDYIIIDEVQRIPELLNEVHRLIEQKHYKFILTGSSARSLKRKGANLLAGRALHYHMHPLTTVELGKDFSLKRALLFGQLPAISSEPAPDIYLETYINTYLREEVQQEGLTRNLNTFSRFLEVASFSQGAILNYMEIGREIGINNKLVSYYFDIVEDLLLGYRLPVFTKRAKRRMISHPKFYYFDTGVYRILRPMGPLDTPEEAEGAALETLFLQEIRAINDYFQLGYDFYYWRTRSGIEVDFIAYGKQGLYAFEIKRKIKLNSADLKGLQAFAKDFPMTKLYLFYGGTRREYYGNIQAIPFEEGLKTLKDLLTH